MWICQADLECKKEYVGACIMVHTDMLVLPIKWPYIGTKYSDKIHKPLESSWDPMITWSTPQREHINVLIMRVNSDIHRCRREYPI